MSFLHFMLCVIFVTLLLYKFNLKFRFYCRFYFIWLMSTWLVYSLLIPIFVLNPRNARNNVWVIFLSVVFSIWFIYEIFYRTASMICRYISTLLGLKWILRGKEYLEKEQACIIVANHQSSLDVLGTYLLFFLFLIFYILFLYFLSY